ncbi:MAG: D-alanyl-D-alanine carboxypeptidase [Oscillospiraceae bacterium]|nr:D-alanyl-D-alanine carboxypeptidase [Oscillospiraceae bacterium]
MAKNSGVTLTRKQIRSIRKAVKLVLILIVVVIVLLLGASLLSQMKPSGPMELIADEYVQLGDLPTQSEMEEEQRKAELRRIEKIFEEKDTYPIDMVIDTPYCVMFDATNEELLFAKAPNEKAYPASTTKIMTAALLMQYAKPDMTFTAGDEQDLVLEGSSLAGLKKGSQLDRDMMLDAIMIPSGNDASYCTAAEVGRLLYGNGGDELSAKEAVDIFVEKMNSTAADIGCTNTHFTCPDGFHDEQHYTTAMDLLKITIYSEKFPEIAASGSKMYRNPEFLTGESTEWYNSNRLLSEDDDYYYMYAKGLKTGMTDQAGYCVVATAKRFDHELIIVCLGSETQSIRWNNTIALFDAGFKYIREKHAEAND